MRLRWMGTISRRCQGASSVPLPAIVFATSLAWYGGVLLSAAQGRNRGFGGHSINSAVSSTGRLGLIVFE